MRSSAPPFPSLDDSHHVQNLRLPGTGPHDRTQGHLQLQPQTRPPLNDDVPGSAPPPGSIPLVPTQLPPRVASAAEDSALPAWLLAAMDSLSVQSLTEETSSGDEGDEVAVHHSEPAFRGEDVAIVRFMPCVASASTTAALAGPDRPPEAAVVAPTWVDYRTEQRCRPIRAEAQATFHAVRTGNVQALARMLDAGECVNLAEDATGNTLLILAADKGHAGVVGLLLEYRDIEVDRKNAGGDTALIVAAQRNAALVMACLLNAGAGINLANRITGDTALIVAARSGHAEAVKLLLYLGDVCIDQVNASGDTALSLSKRNGHEDVVRSLLNAGAGA